MQNDTPPTPDNDLTPDTTPPLSPAPSFYSSTPQPEPVSPSPRPATSFDMSNTPSPTPAAPVQSSLAESEATTSSVEQAPVPHVPVNLDTTSPASALETEVTKPVEPNTSSVFGSTSGPDALVAPAAPVKSGKKKGLVIGLIVAAVLVVLGGGSAAAYNLWYQNSDKVLSDALINTIRAKTVTMNGTVDVKMKDSGSSSNDGTSLKLTVDSKSTNSEGEMNAKLAVSYADQKIDLSGSGLYDKDANFYFKVNNVRKTLDSISTSGFEIPEAFDDIIKKVDGQWIKVASDDLKEFSEESGKVQSCTSDVFKKYENDKAVTKEVIDLYKQYRFVVVKEKLGSKDGSLGYLIETDSSKAKSFVSGLNKTKIAKELQKCDESFKLDADDINTESKNETTARLEVWVDRWSHQLTKLQLSSEEDNTSVDAVVEPLFNKEVSVTAPKDTISITQLKDDIEKAMTAYTDSLYNNPASINVEVDPEV